MTQNQTDCFIDNIWNGHIGDAEKKILERIYQDVYGENESEEKSKNGFDRKTD